MKSLPLVLREGETKVEDGKTFYQIQWTDKRGRGHMVWKRYSRFDTLRSELSKLKKEVKVCLLPSLSLSPLPSFLCAH